VNLDPATRVQGVVRALDFPSSQFFLGGSAALALRGIRHVGDLDVGVTSRLWSRLALEPQWSVWTTNPESPRRCDPPYLVNTVEGVEVNVFCQWRRWSHDETEFNDFNRVFAIGLDKINGIPVIKLHILLRQKVDAVVNCMRDGEPCRWKDLNDIRTISEWIEREEANLDKLHEQMGAR
jgi:hypothetical protein